MVAAVRAEGADGLEVGALPATSSLPSGVPVAAGGVGGTPDAEEMRKRRLARFG